MNHKYAFSRRELVLISLFSSLLVIGTVAVCGTFTSGWHLVDDHEFLRMYHQLHNLHLSVPEVIRMWLTEDFRMRFRPLYHIVRVISVAIFGTNLYIHGIFKVIENILAMILLYCCGREMGAGKTASFFFSTVSLVGFQAAIWWKLGPQEAQCTVLFAAGFFALLRFLKNGKSAALAAAFFSFVLMALYKESYILLLPFLVCYVIYDTCKDAADIRDAWKKLLSKKKALAAIFLFGALFVVLILATLLISGTNNYAGAGISASIGIRQILRSYAYALDEDLRWFKYATLVFVAVLLTYWEELKKLWKEMLLVGAFLLPNLVLYGKEAMSERYLLPSAIGYGMFFFLYTDIWGKLSGKRKKLYLATALLLLLVSARSMWIEADYFRYRGQGVTQALELSSRVAAEPDGKILSCLGLSNPEGDLTMNDWADAHGITEHYYYWNGRDDRIQSVRPYVDADAETTAALREMDLVVMYNAGDRHWTDYPSFYKDGTLTESFDEIPCGSLNLYVRRDAGIDAKIKEVLPPFFSR